MLPLSILCQLVEQVAADANDILSLASSPSTSISSSAAFAPFPMLVVSMVRPSAPVRLITVISAPFFLVSFPIVIATVEWTSDRECRTRALCVYSLCWGCAMKLSCPYCSEKLPYDHRLAGKSVNCSYCKKPVGIPPVQQLPADLQQEYREEVEAQKRKQALQRQREEERQRKLEEDRLRDAQRETERLQKEAEAEAERESQREQQRAWGAKVAEAKRHVPEDDVIGNSYPTLKAIAGVYRCLALFVLFVAIISLLVVLQQSAPTEIKVALSAVTIVSSIAVMAGLILAAECIELIVNIADDLRVSKTLLKKMSYRE